MMRALALGAALAVAAPAVAVGLGPLTKEGVTSSPRKGFYLTLINPYPQAARFRLYGIEWDSETPVTRVKIPVAETALAPQSQRRMLVIDTALAPNETHRFRVCAERVDPDGKALIHARVCSKLVARRLG